MYRGISTDSLRFAKSPSHCSDTALFADKSPWKAVNVDQTSTECYGPKMVCLFQMRAGGEKQVNGQTGEQEDALMSRFAEAQLCARGCPIGSTAQHVNKREGR